MLTIFRKSLLAVFFSFALLLAVFGQKEDDKKPPKPTPPIIKAPSSPKPTPKPTPIQSLEQLTIGESGK